MTHHTLRSSAQRAFVSLACLGLLLGCGEQLDPASLLNKTRPLGIRFSVQGEPARTRLSRPGWRRRRGRGDMRSD